MVAPETEEEGITIRARLVRKILIIITNIAKTSTTTAKIILQRICSQDLMPILRRISCA